MSEPIHIHCPTCKNGWVFQDARGGYECSECDQRFLIDASHPNSYGGPQGPLSWLEKLRTYIGRAILPGKQFVLANERPIITTHWRELYFEEWHGPKSAEVDVGKLPHAQVGEPSGVSFVPVGVPVSRPGSRRPSRQSKKTPG
jgi:hypothetical protein